MKDYPVILITASFISGIILANYFTVSYDVLIVLLTIFSIVFIALVILYLRKRAGQLKKYLLSVAAAIVCVLAMMNLTTEVKTKSLSIHKEKNVYVSGKITSIDLIGERSVSIKINCDTVLFSDSILLKNIQLIGRIFDNNKIILDSLYKNMYPGYEVSLKGTFSSGREKRNPGEFNYREYLLAKNISGSITVFSAGAVKIKTGERELISSAIFDIRKAIDKVISEYHKKETAGLLRGLLLADRSEISADAKTDFINSGVVHILAVSGLHVGYIIMIFLIISGRMNIRLRLLLTMLGILFFLLITNSPASVFRASVMAIVVILARMSGRSSNIYNSLSLAALIILVIESRELFNPGFQLSFSAVFAIAVIVPALKKIINSSFMKSGLIKNILLLLAVSLSAQIGTLPFTLMYFGKFSLIGIFANLFVIPLAGLIIAIGIFTLALSLVSTILASMASATNIFLSGILYDAVHVAGNIDYSFMNVFGFTALDSILYYFFLVVFIICHKKFLNLLPKILLIIIIVLNIYLYTSLDNVEFFKKNQLNILMIDVGQGDAILVKFPNGKTALIDAGDATFYYDAGEKIVLPLLNYLGIGKIDYGIVSHLDTDHYGGFVSLIHHKKINSILKLETDSSQIKDLRFESYLNKNNVQFEFYRIGKSEFGNVRLYCLTGDLIRSSKLSNNNRSGVLKLVYGETEILFTGDIEKQSEHFYATSFGSFLESDILKVAHHGGKTSTTDGFLFLVKPEISLISAGVQNKFRHPSSEVISRLQKYGSKIIRTDESGAILLTSDGTKFSQIVWN